MECTDLELALHAARQMDGKGAEDLRVLKLHPRNGALYDYVVIASGRSDRQVNTLVNEVWHFTKRHQIAHKPVEGEASWMLIDLHEVIVHAFTEEARGFYDLERLWNDAEDIDWQSALNDLPDPDANREEVG